MQNFNRLPSLHSRLYVLLLEKGGDDLIAVYATLKAYKNGRTKYSAHKSTKGKTVKNYGLLRKETPLSLSTLKKYIPMLIELGLCRFNKDGDFVLTGNNTLNEKFSNSRLLSAGNRSKNKPKLIKITIGKNLAETKLFSFLVRINSNYNSQLKSIEKKQQRKNIIAKIKLSEPLSPKEYTIYKYMKRKGMLEAVSDGSEKSLSITPTVVLSQQGFAKLKERDLSRTSSGENESVSSNTKRPSVSMNANKSSDQRSKGQYYREKLRQKGLIQTVRQYQQLREVEYSTYLYLRREMPYLRWRSTDGVPKQYRTASTKGMLFQETASEFVPVGLLEGYSLAGSDSLEGVGQV